MKIQRQILFLLAALPAMVILPYIGALIGNHILYGCCYLFSSGTFIHYAGLVRI